MGIKILVADCHELVLQAIKILLNNENDIDVIVTDDGYECLDIVNKKKPDILIISSKIKSISGFDVIKIIREQQINVKYIGLPEYTEKNIILEMYQSGFHGIIPKTCSYNELVDIIRRVYKGDMYIDDRMSTIIREETELVNKKKNLINSLTKREYDILVLLSSGKYNNEIALLLNITERTVKNHIYSIYRKLNVNDRTQAAIYAIHNIL